MKKQSTQVIMLVSLLVIWAVLWRIFIKIPKAQPPVEKAATAKTSQSETLLHARFRHVRSQMDALYHFRTKPTPLDLSVNPFRVPVGIDLSFDGDAPPSPPIKQSKVEAAATTVPPATADTADALLKAAVANMKIGGVVTLNGISKLTVDGQLHKEGDVFSTKITSAKATARSVIVRIKHLSKESATLVLEEPDSGQAEVKVRLN